MPDSSDIKRETLESYLGQLYKQYEASYGQLSRTLSDADAVKIKQQIATLEQEIQETEAKLRQLESSSGDTNRRHLNWQASLPEINFEEAVKTFQQIVSQFGWEGGAALFLMQNAHLMGGKWCVARLRGLLKAADFKHYEIEFAPEARLDAESLLSRLGQYVGCEPIQEIQDAEQYAQAIRQHTRTVVGKICDSLQNGSVVFIELRLWDTLCLQDRFLPWFLHDFWIPLVHDEWQAIVQKHPMVKFIAVIVANTPISSGGLPASLCCTQHRFDQAKVLELPLQAWTLDEIRTWLYVFSGLGLAKLQIEQMATVIYQASGNGQPALVHTALMEALDKHLG